MPKFLVCLTRSCSEDASCIVEADDEDGAKVAARAIGDKLCWRPGDSPSADDEVYHLEQVDDTEQTGVEVDESSLGYEHGEHLVELLRTVDETCKGMTFMQRYPLEEVITRIRACLSRIGRQPIETR